MYLLVKKQYLADGTSASSLVEYTDYDSAIAAMRYELWYAHESHMPKCRIIILGEEGEYEANEVSIYNPPAPEPDLEPNPEPENGEEEPEENA